jgi:thioredoxin 1
LTLNYTNVTDETFSIEISNNGQPVVMAFTAAWCGSCHIMEPIIDRVSSQFSNKIKFCKVDYDLNPFLIERYGIHELPTLLVFFKGELVDHRCGTVTQNELADMLDPLLKG